MLYLFILYTHTRIHTHINTHIYTHIHTHIHTFIHTYTYTHTQQIYRLKIQTLEKKTMFKCEDARTVSFSEDKSLAVITQKK